MTHTSGSFVLGAALTTLTLFAACGGGGGSGTGIPASVPDGTGQIAIQMIGTWEVRVSQVLESNDPAAAPPLNGTLIVIGPQGVASIGGLSVSRPSLEAVLGFPLDLYVNQVDGKTILYGIGYDRRAQGGIRQQVGVAAGSVNDDTIFVEQYVGSQSATQANEVFTRSHYTLVRISSAILVPADEAPRTGDQVVDLAEALKPLFGR